MSKELDKFEEEIVEANDQDEEIDYREQEIMMLPERNALERVGVPRVFQILRTVIDSSGQVGRRLEDLNRKIFRMNLSEEDRFKIYMSFFYQRFYEQLNLSEADLDALALLADKLDHIGKKNPYAFVLGYSVLSSKKISQKKFKNIEDNVIDSVEEVSLPDVIRYAKLVQSLS